MSRTRNVALLVAVGLIVSSCSSSDGTSNPASSSEGDAAPTAAGGETPVEPAAAYETGDSTLIFDQDRFHTFQLDLAPELLAKIDADPAAEEYVEGTLTFAGETLPVGIRYKGSVGAFVNCLSGSNIFEPSGEKTCTKLSMKVKANWNDSDDTFYGLKKLQFHAQNLDPSMMHERLGYWLFREMGVPAPRSVHARIVVNGEYLGVFALTEQIDGRFTRENFEDGTGNLYREVWPVTPLGKVFPEKEYLQALKTNEDEDSSPQIIVGFGSALESAEPEDVPAVLEAWVDVDEMLAYAVVDRAIGNDDGVFHFYCADSAWCTSHNYFWYEDPSTATLHLIPWDLDNAFENILQAANPVTPIADGWGETTNDCKPFRLPGTWIEQRSAACDPILGGLVAFDKRYRQQLAAFLDGPFSAERVEAQLETWTAQIAEAVAEAAAAHRDAVSPRLWSSALDNLRAQLDVARERAAV